MSQPAQSPPSAIPTRAPGPRVATAIGQAPIIPIGLMVVGGYLMWFGVHYWRSDQSVNPAAPVKAILQGKAIPDKTTQDPKFLGKLITSAYDTTGGGSTVDTSNSGATGGTLTGPHPEIAAAALKYLGAGYQFGGRADKVGNWDCSSFVSYVVGHDLGIALPGGKWGDPGYPPHAHGPTASRYKLYGTGINQSQLGAGDIVAWNTHCGIAVDGHRIVSARTPAEGVGISTIDGTSQSIGETPVFRRVSGTSAATGATIAV